MSTTRHTTIAALAASLALSVLPAAAQDGRRGWQGQAQEGQQQSRPRAERRRPRDGGTQGQGGEARRPEGSRPQAGRPEAPRPEAGRSERDRDDRQAEPRREAVPRGEVYRNDNRDRDRDNGRGRDDGRRAEPQRGGRDDWRNDRWRDNRPRYVPAPAPRAYRYSHPPRVYVVPYGYRPQGYRPGWSLNLYFGRPYGYGPGYYGNGGYGGYGYYALRPGFAYGSLRIVDAPRDAQVFVDGYYAGVVDDYDGVFQRLNLEPGPHHIELDVYPGAPPLEFEVYVEPGRSVTIHARP